MSAHIITAEYQAGSILDRRRHILFHALTEAAARKALARMMKKYAGLYDKFEIEPLTAA